MRGSSALLLVLLPLLFGEQQRLTPVETRKLAMAAMPKNVASRSVTIELDREQTGCAIYHAYSLGGIAPYFNTATLGWWSVDIRTAEVWDEQKSERVTNRQIDAIQVIVRKRLGVTSAEISASISNPCYERYSK